jgi:Methyltransferase domain
MPYYSHHWVPVDAVSDLTPPEWDTLSQLLRSGAFRSYIEVGVGHLGTFANVARLVRDTNMETECHGIDAFGALPPDPNGQNSHEGDVVRLAEAQAFLEAAQLEIHCQLHRGDSAPLLTGLLGDLPAPRMVFIDGNHTYEGCRLDFVATDKHLRPGDVVILHDACRDQHPDYGRGPRGVVEDLILANPKYKVTALPAEDVRHDYLTTNAMCVSLRVADPADTDG